MTARTDQQKKPVTSGERQQPSISRKHSGPPADVLAGDRFVLVKVTFAPR
jgi:hypothetical protein